MMTQNTGGTIHYMPPEALRHVYRDKRASLKPIDGRKWDVYSCALCVLFAYTGEDPFAEMASLTVVRKMLDEDIKPKIGHEVPKTLHSLIKDMWSTNPSHRPTMKDATNRLEKALRHEIKLAPPTPKSRASSASIKSASMEKRKKKKKKPPTIPTSSSSISVTNTTTTTTTTRKKRPPVVPPPVIKRIEKQGPIEPSPTKPTISSSDVSVTNTTTRKEKRPPLLPPPAIKKKKRKKKKKKPPAIPPLPSKGSMT